MFVCIIYYNLFLLASEVSEMNHEATRLTEHLTALRGDSEQVVDLLTQLKAENEVKREKEERKKTDELKLINKSVLHVQQELEVSRKDLLYIYIVLYPWLLLLAVFN